MYLHTINTVNGQLINTGHCLIHHRRNIAEQVKVLPIVAMYKLHTYIEVFLRTAVLHQTCRNLLTMKTFIFPSPSSAVGFTATPQMS